MLDDIAIWLNHFENHATHPRSLPQGTDASLAGRERSLIAASIATFQLGECSQGRHLLAAARTAAGPGPVVRVLELLVAEERRHAELLGQFMDDHAIPRRRRHWSNSVFRALRRLGGLQGALSVLLSAELVGIVYYRALECATGCAQLRVLARMLVADELVHVAFEAELLRALWARRPALTLAACCLQRLLLGGTALAVWASHRRVLRCAGHSARTFLRACVEQYTFQLGRPLPRTALPDPHPLSARQR
ncbi:MAG TPA: hypothetical protein VMB48_04315 [Steroidobacteraceae bacterium]|nr:hypothetical protein [Steroidobacteraceae bacterium]